jgi:ABC-type transport system involved in multi-copper enzyme maturation permease subunit
MLGTMIKKEIVTTVLDLRFVIASLLFLVLIPLGMYVSRKDYEQRLANYNLEHQMYRQKYGKEVSSKVEVRGFRTPSVLSIFASGLDHYIPDKVITSRSGIFSTTKDVRAGDSPALLFGRMDLLFNVCFVASLVALVFTFSSISGERQAGTLGLMLANPIPRSHILLSKIAGNYICLLIPFVMSLLIASIILELSQDISILLPQLYPSYLIILVVTLVFILTMVTLGVLISGMTQKPIISMTVSLFVWVIIVLALPKVSPMLARIIYPVEAEQVVNLRKQMALEDIEKTFKQKSIDIHNKYLQQIPEKLINEYFQVKPHETESYLLQSQYKSVVPLDKELIALAQENNKRIANEIGQIAQNHKNKMNIQNTIAMNISRLSPACCYSYLISGLSNTGTREYDKLMENAQQFQDQVKTAIYDKYQRRVWKIGGMTTFGGTRLHEFPETVPDMQYRYSSLVEILEAGLVDVILSISFTFLFFTLAFVTFNRYDVRS